jgi:hypothetical protein
MTFAPSAGGAREVAMLRMCVAAIVLATLGAGGHASAQTGCQPTITQPCAAAPDKRAAEKPGVSSPAARRPDSGQSDEPKDHSPRIKLDRDTDFKFGTGGIGIGRKF